MLMNNPVTAVAERRDDFGAALRAPARAAPDAFACLQDRGRTIDGHMAASWIYIGTRGILQSACETLAELARRHVNGSLTSRLVVSTGLAGIGSALPVGVTMHGGIAIIIELDAGRIERQIAATYIDDRASGLGDALARAERYRPDRVPRSIAVEGNAADLLPELIGHGVVPDVVIDRTSAHDSLNGYVPNGLSFADAGSMRRNNPARYVARSREALAQHVRAMADLERRGSVVFDYGKTMGAHREKAGVGGAWGVPGVAPEYMQPLPGLVRHANAGYLEVIDAAQRQGIDMPSLSSQGGLGR